MLSSDQNINLVSGGAGFIGSNLIGYLLEKGEKVVCIDNFLNGSYQNIFKFIKNPNFRLIEQCIIEDLDEEINMIWHLACPASPKYYYQNPIYTSNIIFQGTLNLLKYALKKNAKFLLASTSEIYGEIKEFPIKENFYGNVKTTSRRSCYSEAKRLAETLCYDFYRKYSLDIRIARIFNTYGPNMSNTDGRVINTFITNCISNKPLFIFGNGDQTRSFCYITDLIEGLFLLKESDFIEPMNLGYPSEISINKLVEIIKTKTNSNSEIIFKKNNENEPFRRVPSIELAEKYLNWHPKVSLNLGLDYTIKYFIDQINKI